MFTKPVINNTDREFIVECIRLYRDLPSLWNTKSKEYHDRKKKNEAYQLLVNKFRERFPNVTQEDVKRKINSMRTCYRKELKRHLQSLKDGPSLVYEPTLYYYNEMRFLRDQERSLDSHSAVKVDNSLDPIADVIVRENSNAPQCASPLIVHKKKAVKLQKLEELMDLACNHLRDNTDEYKHWAMACAADLQKMDPTQQIYAKKAIAEILMEGQLGLLHRHSVQINEQSDIKVQASDIEYVDNESVEYGSPTYE